MIRFALHLLFLVACVGALLRPRWGIEEDHLRAQGIDLTICLDVSHSMWARDLAPDRLQRAKAELSALLPTLTVDRLALVVFAGEAKRLTPLTADRAYFLEQLQGAGPESVRQGGTDLAAALDLARELLQSAAPGQRNLLLISDGEDRDGSGREAALRCAEQGITVHTLAIGTAAGGRITLRDEEGRESFLQDDAGEAVLTRLDSATLHAIATATGGLSLSLEPEVGVLPRAYEERWLPALGKAMEGEGEFVAAERYRWPLSLALLCAAALLAGFGRRRR